MKDELLKILENTNANHVDAETAQVQVLDLFNVRLSFLQPENCPEWAEGVGDCKKPDCTFCKIETEIEGNEA
jgi:hypothetical protein